MYLINLFITKLTLLQKIYTIKPNNQNPVDIFTFSYK